MARELTGVGQTYPSACRKMEDITDKTDIKNIRGDLFSHPRNILEISCSESKTKIGVRNIGDFWLVVGPPL